MNDKALQVLYGLAQSDGYSNSFEDFKVLMSSNENAVSQMYSLAQADGYQNSRSNFNSLVGFGGGETVEVETEVQEGPLKKKEGTVSPSGLSSLGLPSVTDIIEEKAEVEAPQAPPGMPFSSKTGFETPKEKEEN